MGSAPKISVMMAVRNGEKFLQEALDSVLTQEGVDFEFVAVDDGSTDGTVAILEACRDPRLRIVRNTNHGLVNALNLGFASVRGDYIARMDSDDVCLPGRLAKQSALLDANPDVDMVHASARIIDDSGKGSRIIMATPGTQDDYRAVLTDEVPGKPIINPTVMIRRSSLAQTGGYRDSPSCEDHEFWLRVLDSWKFMAIPEVLLLYRQHLGGISRVNSREQATSHVMNCVAYRIRRETGIDLFDEDPATYHALRTQLGLRADAIMPTIVAVHALRRHVKLRRWGQAWHSLVTVVRNKGLPLLRDQGVRSELQRLQREAMAEYKAVLARAAKQG